MRKMLAAGLLLAIPFASSPGEEVRFAPILMESADIPPFRHRLTTRLDLSLDAFEDRSSTETLKGLHTRAQPLLEYRYAPAKNTEFFFRVRHTIQTVEFTAPDGTRTVGSASSGLNQPEVGFKFLLSPGLAAALHTSPPTTASRAPPLGDGPHYGGKILLKKGRWHAALGHTVRLPHVLHASTRTFRMDAGDVSEFSIGLTRRDIPAYAKKDYVGPSLEIAGVYADRLKRDGSGVRESSALSGRATFGFVLGKINKRALHLTKFALSVGFGDTLHKTRDPFFSVADLRLTLGYGCRWGKTAGKNW